MKKLIFVLFLAMTPLVGMAGGGGVPLRAANIDLSDQKALQRGAKYYVNYCYGCHALTYMRYSRLAADLGLSPEAVIENLMFTGDKIGERMNIAMSPGDAERWFGTPPPDLTLVSRSRGVDWLYTYLKSFYVDDTRPLGFNNLVFRDVGMPHVLWELQGPQKAVFRSEGNHEVFDKFESLGPGKLTADQYDRLVRDLVAFLAYAGEPIKLERNRIGVWVLLFLAVFFVIAYLLKKEYWKDVH